jgi:small-conductance mechanosensitive channel
VIARHPADMADNLAARRIQTQTRVLARIASGTALVAGLALVLMTFPRARQVGTSLLASAGVAGLIVGLAARSVFSNLLAGLQIALAQPIRIDDVLIVQGEWGRVEEITATYVVLRIWDERRLIVPLGWFIENPFQNWTRRSAEILGTVFLWLDYTVPVDAIRAEARRLCEASPHWDRRVCVVQVTDASDRAVQLRILVSSVASGANFDLRCELREALIDFVRREYPAALPRVRADMPAPQVS